MGKELQFVYKNWKGVVGSRSVMPVGLEYVTDNEYHGSCWCMVAMDLDKGKERVFAIKDIISFL